MAGRIPAATKQELQRRNLWQTFLDRRAALVDEGLRPNDAKDQAISELLSNAVPTPPPAVVSPPEVPDGAAPALASIEAHEARMAVADGRSSGLPAALERQLSERRASPRQVVEWVFENLYNEHPDAGNAPSLGAWGLLQSCKSHREVRAEFLKNIWPRLIPTRAQLDDEERFRDDGRDLRELATALLDKQRDAEPKPAS